MTTAADPITEYRSWAVEEFRFEEEPYYVPVSDEVEVFQAAWNNKLPVLLKGPTGCGKTRFIEYMAYHLNRPLAVMRDGRAEIEQETNLPLVTVGLPRRPHGQRPRGPLPARTQRDRLD